MVDDNNENSERRLKLAFKEEFDKLINTIDKDYKELLSLSLEDTLKQAEKYDFNHQKKWDYLFDLYIVGHKLANKIDHEHFNKLFHKSNHPFVLIINWLRNIKNNKCNKCKNKLTEENCYIYLRQKKKIKKFALDKIHWTDHQAGDTLVLFCSEICYKKSSYYQDETKQEQTNKQRENSPSQQSENDQTSEDTYQEYLFCSECYLEINSKTYFTHQTKKDDKFCSEKCFNDFYHGKNCYNCYKKFPEWELKLLQTLLSDKLLCSNCYPEEKAKQDQFEEANKKYCQDCKVELNEFNQQSNLYFCKTCWEKATRRIREKNNLNLDNEQNRTEQNRTEQNRTEQNRTEQNRTEQNRTEQNRTEQNRTEQNRTEQNAGNELTNQINNLQKEITQLESQTNPNQNLLNLKKEELRNLENKLNSQKQSIEPNNNSKLILGIGMGVLGLGLIGLVVWLVLRRKKND